MEAYALALAILFSRSDHALSTSSKLLPPRYFHDFEFLINQWLFPPHNSAARAALFRMLGHYFLVFGLSSRRSTTCRSSVASLRSHKAKFFLFGTQRPKFILNL